MAKMKYEGSALDERRDRKAAKKAGKSMKEWEDSPQDRKMDRKGQREMDKKGKRR